MRTFIQSLALAAALALAAPTVASAASAEAKEQKAVVKDAKKDLKTLDKIIKKYGKAIDKDKDTGELDGEINAIVKAEIKELRQMGIQINEPEPEPGPAFPGDPHTVPAPESDNPWLEKFRDQLLAVREAKNAKPRLKQLEDLRGMFATRLERQEKKLDKM